jgi:ligand-binding SRPBCC domain-containing protein
MICLADFDEVEHAAKWAFHNACLLNLAWEISEMDAKKVAISRAKAFNSLFLRFTPLKNWGAKISAADMEEYFIDACRDEPHKALEYILTPTGLLTKDIIRV